MITELSLSSEAWYLALGRTSIIWGRIVIGGVEHTFIVLAEI
jgi:hypothetical protein